MAFFKDIATPLIKLGIPVIPLRSKTKQAFLSDWTSLATTDPQQIEAWDKEYPEANVASVAKAHISGVWFWEVDRPDVATRVQDETGKSPFAIETFKVRSRPGRGHFYFKQSERSIAMGNLAQGFVKNEDWSARVDNQYVVGPGSWHPDSGQQYHVISDLPLVEAPDWLIDWLISQKKVDLIGEAVAKVERVEGFSYIEPGQREFKPIDITIEGPQIPYGAHDVTLTAICGKLHYDDPSLSEDELCSRLIIICEARCVGYKSDYREMCSKIAHSIGKRPVPVDTFAQEVAERAQAVAEEQEKEPAIETTSIIPRPTFPSWVMRNTSLWQGLVDPVARSSDKYPELIFMPAVLMFMNYLGTKVVIKNRPFVPSLFLGIISPYGKFFKSTSCEVAMEYFRAMNVAMNHNSKMTNSDGKTVIISPGSTEGLGLEMSRANAKNAVIFFDELGKFVRKSTIESSSFTEDMLSFYEARRFSNAIKARKESFTFDPNTYCFSWLWCTTDRKFPSLWSKIPGDSTGLNSRMFFLLTPEEPKRARFHEQLDSYSFEGIQKTRERISAALAKKEYIYDEWSNVDKHFDGLEGREQALAERLALYFAIDTGHETILEQDIEKAKALALYARQTLAYLEPVEADSLDGRIAKIMVRELQRSGGKLPYRDFYRKLDGLGGGRLWTQVFEWLCRQGIVAYRAGQVGGKSRRPAMVYLLKEEEA
jgi:Bifunctional DNA primase/polymerase, N-terminal